MVVMAIVLTILSIAVPMYTTSMIRAKESVLKSNLFTMRSVIDHYTYDKEAPPQGLEDLVAEGYFASSADRSLYGIERLLGSDHRRGPNR